MVCSRFIQASNDYKYHKTSFCGMYGWQHHKMCTEKKQGFSFVASQFSHINVWKIQMIQIAQLFLAELISDELLILIWCRTAGGEVAWPLFADLIIMQESGSCHMISKAKHSHVTWEKLRKFGLRQWDKLPRLHCLVFHCLAVFMCCSFLVTNEDHMSQNYNESWSIDCFLSHW